MNTLCRRSLPVVGVCAGTVLGLDYGHRAASQTAKPTAPVTLSALAARVTALEAENRRLRERVTELEREPIIVPMSSISQTTEGYAYAGMPVRQYPHKLLGPLAASPRPLILPETPSLLDGPRTGYGPPPQIPDSREVDGMTLLRGSADARP